MFDSLKKRLKESIEKLSRKTESDEVAFRPQSKTERRAEARMRPQTPSTEGSAFRPQSKTEGGEATFRPEGKAEQKKEAPESVPVKEEVKEGFIQEKTEKRGFLGRFREKVATRAISDSDIEEFFSENEMDMLEANVAVEVVDFLKQRLKENLAKKQAKRFGAKDIVQEAFEDSLYDVVNQGTVNIEDIIKKARLEGRPACMIFLGFNGSGKTTSIAKLAHYLKSRGFTPVIAAADTFRAASIEQLEVHGERLGVKIIKHQYGADSAAVVFDAIKFASTKGYDIVLADTAGRSHADKNLMDELTKVVRVNKPDLKVLVVDSLTGNDAVEQAKTFDKAAGVDAIVLTKVDVNKKGGAILSVCYAIKKPILFLGVGQDYENVEMFEPRKFARELLE